MSKLSNILTMAQLLRNGRKYSIKDLSGVDYSSIVKKLYKYNGEL